MSKYDVHHWRKDESILLLIIQSDLFNEISTRLVIPLIEYRSAEKEGQEILKPNLIIREKPYVLMVTDMASIPKQEIGDFVGNVSSSRSEIQRAIEFFLQGFEAL